MKLTDSTIRTVKPKKTAQKLSDGGGLFLHVLPNGSKHWRMAYRFDGKQKLLSFGLYPLVTLREARDKRDEAKKLLLNGVEPLALKQEAKAAKEAAEKDERENLEAVPVVRTGNSVLLASFYPYQAAFKSPCSW